MTHRRRRVPSLCATAVGIGLLWATATATAAPVAGADDATPPVPGPGRPWFGPGLDWSHDSAADYAGRLGTTPSLYAQRVNYPLDADDVSSLERFAQEAGSQGAVAALVLEPQEDLDELTKDDAAALGTELAGLHDKHGGHFLVRFAPEMNGWWTSWGQQPGDYVRAFRRVAEAVHGASDHAEMVWAPVYGAGYPFGRALDRPRSAEQRTDRKRLDTTGDGRLGDGDDPYGPYFPGDRWVDWAGLHMYRYGGRSNGNNVAPRPGEVEARLEDRFRYSAGARRPSFYDRFAGAERPMLVETAALFEPSNERGDSERKVKQTWWRQLFAAASDRPSVGAISWLELARPEAETDEELADWRVTHRPELAAALRADLEASGIVTGSVTRVVEASEPSEPSQDSAADREDEGASAAGSNGESTPQVVTIGPLTPGWIVLIAVSLGVVYMRVRSMVRRRRAAG